eukprot:360973-Chlamydomonas_euryale.AAC.9
MVAVSLSSNEPHPVQLQRERQSQTYGVQTQASYARVQHSKQSKIICKVGYTVSSPLPDFQECNVCLSTSCSIGGSDAFVRKRQLLLQLFRCSLHLCSARVVNLEALHNAPLSVLARDWEAVAQARRLPVAAIRHHTHRHPRAVSRCAVHPVAHVVARRTGG